ncbi:WcbI family polysaccharide biosynthesis putative acetyltransferase [Frondihabitans cladoniiphilus]|uniref:Polysaccharide biosynthesis enzyme WcbI domain-containing protein n=1 Tax=Frondihabitans cladoniiphilus TaxID=715785 RepID=A0ABP8W3A7_9MICO
MPSADAIDPRTRHYGDFYGLSEPPGDGPVVVIVGNCQAESLRIVLDGGGVRSVRLPAVHELVASDLPYLDRWLGEADVLVSQPIRDGYHGLPLGTTEMSGRMRVASVTVTVPVIRFAGLFPAAALVRPPSDPSLVPPVVEYHDLRLLAEAAGRGRAGTAGRDKAARPLTTDVVRAVGAHSLAELRKREQAFDTVVASDLFERPSFDLMRTLNHPGNPVWNALAGRVRERLGWPAHDGDPGRPLLDSVHAPHEEVVLEAWELDGSPTENWLVHGRVVTSEEVRRAHLDWYAEHPEVVAAGLARHADTLALLESA